jgi:hypothetical protein
MLHSIRVWGFERRRDQTGLDRLQGVELVYVNEDLLNNIRVLENCRTPRGSVCQIKFFPRFRRSDFGFLNCPRGFVEHE